MNKIIKSFINISAISKALGFSRNTLGVAQQRSLKYKNYSEKYADHIKKLYEYVDQWYKELEDIKNINLK